MADIAALWQSSSRKEVMDLLQTIWPALDHASRNKLSHAIVTGSPDHLLAQVDVNERVSSRDRRIYDRIIVLERVDSPPLTDVLINELARICSVYPEWRAMPGNGRISAFGQKHVSGLTRGTALLI